MCLYYCVEIEKNSTGKIVRALCWYSKWGRKEENDYGVQDVVCHKHLSSSTCSTESTTSLISSKVTPGMMRSASVNARWRALRATRASWVDTRGNSYKRTCPLADNPDWGAVKHREKRGTYRCNCGKNYGVEHCGIGLWQIIVHYDSLACPNVDILILEIFVIFVRMLHTIKSVHSLSDRLVIQLLRSSWCRGWERR